MTRKIAVIAVVALVSALLVGGALSTGAWLKDTDTSSANDITGGTLNVTVDNEDGTPLSEQITINNDKLKPGDWVQVGTANITNGGNLPGQLSLGIKNIINNENGITDPEADANDTTPAGELGSFIAISPQENVSPWTRYTAMSGLVDNATLSTQGRVLQPGETIQIVFYAVWTPTDTDNLAQGDSISFDIEFTLDQLRP